MTRGTKLMSAAVFAGFTVSAWAQSSSIPAGANLVVRTNETIDAKSSSDGRIYTGVVDQDVMGTNGAVAIPRGSNAELIVRGVGNREMAVDLESVNVAGRRYIVSATDTQAVTSGQKDGLGKNSRTGKYVGGGAVLGTIIGAIAGGGKGAAIGALAGGAAGAGTQVLTRGPSVRVPAESLLTFRLQQPLTVATGAYAQDPGYTRNGRHYHRRVPAQ